MLLFGFKLCAGMVHAQVMRRAVRRAVRHAPCGVRAVACCALLLLHLLGCIVSVARCNVRVGCCHRHRATVRHAPVQGPYGRGGVLYMTSGRATFESVAISDTTARKVRVATEAGRV